MVLALGTTTYQQTKHRTLASASLQVRVRASNEENEEKNDEVRLVSYWMHMTLRDLGKMPVMYTWRGLTVVAMVTVLDHCEEEAITWYNMCYYRSSTMEFLFGLSLPSVLILSYHQSIIIGCLPLFLSLSLSLSSSHPTMQPLSPSAAMAISIPIPIPRAIAMPRYPKDI